MSIIISVDIGTSKICAAAYCRCRGKLLSYVSLANNSFVEGQPAGSYEQSAAVTIEIVFSAVKALLGQGLFSSEDVDGIAVTGQMHGVLLIDEFCRPVTNLITWRDRRADNQAARIGEKYAKSNGCGLRGGYGGASLALLGCEGRIKSGYKALSISDYLCCVLSGCAASEPTHAASWGIFDITDGKWNEKIIDELSIPRAVLPRLNPTSGVLGNIIPAIADELGLSHKAAVYSPIGDNQAAVIGARGTAINAAVLNLGTGGQLSIPRTSGEYVDGFETRPMPDGSFILVGASICGGWTYAYLKDFFKSVVKDFAAVELEDERVYNIMNSFLSAQSNGAGLYVDPRFSGTRANSSVRGAINQIDAANFTPCNLTNAFARAMVRELYDMVPAGCPDNFSTIIACGNAVRKNPAVLSIAAECFGKTVYAADTREEASVGAALAVISEQENYC